MSSWYFNRLFPFFPPSHPLCIPSSSFCAPSFRGVSGVKIHETRESRAGDGGSEKRKATKGKAAQRSARVGKINCERRCTAIKSVLTGPWRSRGDSMFKQQIAHRRFMNARRQVLFDTRIKRERIRFLFYRPEIEFVWKRGFMLQHAFRTTGVFMRVLRFDVREYYLLHLNFC